MKRWIIGITGASGMRFVLRMLEVLSQDNFELHVVISDAGIRVLDEEEGIRVGSDFSNLLSEKKENIIFHKSKDIGASIASGTFKNEGMVICPCSMSTVGAIANGLSMNLVHRAAEVTLKEKRSLVIVPRETPLSLIHLKNLTVLSEAGVSIVPAMPGFYHKPKTIEELVDMMVMKILDVMKINSDLVSRWKENRNV